MVAIAIRKSIECSNFKRSAMRNAFLYVDKFI